MIAVLHEASSASPRVAWHDRNHHRTNRSEIGFAFLAFQQREVTVAGFALSSFRLPSLTLLRKSL